MRLADFSYFARAYVTVVRTFYCGYPVEMVSKRSPISEGTFRRPPTGAAAFIPERSMFFRQPLRWLAGFVVVGVIVRSAALWAAKSSFEEERARQEARDAEDMAAEARRRSASALNYERVWSRVFAEEARIAEEEEAQSKILT